MAFREELIVRGELKVGGDIEARGAVNSYNTVALANIASDTTSIHVLESGKEYFFGTDTGIAGATDGANNVTFQLPAPRQIGEKIKIVPQNAAVVAKLLGISSAVPATVNITYFAIEAGAVVETASTALGTNGTENTMVKLDASHYKIGDVIECTSSSATNWQVRIIGGGGLIAIGDIAVAAGNAAGYIA